MNDSYKEVYFSQYCKACRHEADDENDISSPCYDCLAEPVNVFSHKPTRWKEKAK